MEQTEKRKTALEGGARERTRDERKSKSICDRCCRYHMGLAVCS